MTSTSIMLLSAALLERACCDERRFFKINNRYKKPLAGLAKGAITKDDR